jgi:hypothetical protein
MMCHRNNIMYKVYEEIECKEQNTVINMIFETE